MTVKPLVAVVGRPNVGKSTFFNKIAGQRIAIVEDVPGVTRDRVCADCEWLNYRFTLIDTGGIDPRSTDPLRVQMRHQAEIAMDMADPVLRGRKAGPDGRRRGRSQHAAQGESACAARRQ